MALLANNRLTLAGDTYKTPNLHLIDARVEKIRQAAARLQRTERQAKMISLRLILEIMRHADQGD